MMITIYHEYYENIPALVVVNPEKKDQALPVLTYIHGFTSAKEHNLPLAYLMAEKGYRVILPDCMYHGERAENLSQEEIQFRFFQIVAQNIKDIAIIKNELDKVGLILDGRFGLAGTSMGGITTSSALTQFPWIKTAAVLMGSPKITKFATELIDGIKKQTVKLPMSEQQIHDQLQSLEEIDLSMQMEKLNGRPLFFWHGEADYVVPFKHSYSFYEEAIDHYKDPEKIRFLREVGRGHKVSRFAILETVNWFELQL